LAHSQAYPAYISVTAGDNTGLSLYCKFLLGFAGNIAFKLSQRHLHPDFPYQTPGVGRFLRLLLGQQERWIWALERMAGMPRIADEAPSRLDNRVQWAYHQCHDRGGMRIVTLPAEMGNSGKDAYFAPP